MHRPRVENVTFWRATRCGFAKIAQKRQKKSSQIVKIWRSLWKASKSHLCFLLNFLIRKIKEWEFQIIFCRSLPYFYTYPGIYHCKIYHEFLYMVKTLWLYRKKTLLLSQVHKYFIHYLKYLHCSNAFWIWLQINNIILS